MAGTAKAVAAFCCVCGQYAAAERVAVRVVGEAVCRAVAGARVCAGGIGGEQGVAELAGEAVLLRRVTCECRLNSQENAAWQLHVLLYNRPGVVPDVVRAVTCAGVVVEPAAGVCPGAGGNGVFVAGNEPARDVTVVVHAHTRGAAVVLFVAGAAVTAVVEQMERRGTRTNLRHVAMGVVGGRVVQSVAAAGEAVGVVVAEVGGGALLLAKCIGRFDTPLSYPEAASSFLQV